MPYSYTREQVEEYWGWCGEIESLDMLTFPDSGRFRGIAFITFRTQEGYDAALACDGEALDGQTLKVGGARSPARSRFARALHVETAGQGFEVALGGRGWWGALGTRKRSSDY